ncbi:hypothetical protein Bca52824_065169 [Brassica carinata]|uniref:DUF4283 domain-containing protein n=1 Tax=Brassica carinata TaxID=52824 RepID=A0A8X7U9Q6_BRACI|nr:hypothetical protein Bca52824_065169 [Brassica carinata]
MTAPEQGGSSPEKEGMQIGATESNLIGEKEVSAVAVTAEVGEANMVRVFSTVADLSSGNSAFEGAPLWEDCLLGKFLDKAPHDGAIHATVKRIWSLGDKEIKVEVYVVNDYTVKFWISDAKVRARVLRRGILIVEDVQPEMKTIPLWVVLKNVPRTMFSWNGLSSLTSPFGEPKKLHAETLWCRNFEEAKVFVEVDLSKKLPEFYDVPLKNGSLAANDSGNAQSARSDPADTGASKSQKKTMSAVSRSKQLFEPKSPATLATAKGSGSFTVSPSKAAKQPVKETVIDEISSPSRFSSISGMEDGFYNGDDEEVNCDEKPFEDDRVECQRVKLVESKNPKLTKQRETFGTVTRASTRASQSLHTDGKCGSNSPGDFSQKSLSNKKKNNRKKGRSKKHHH